MDNTGDDDRIEQQGNTLEHSTFDGEDIYAEDGSIRSDFLMHVGAAIADRDLLFLRRHVARLHESEMGDLLEAIQPEQRRQLVSLLGADFDLAALTEVDEAIRLDIVEHLPNEQIAAAIGEMDSDDAVYILEDLDQEDQEEILSKLPFTERIRLRRSLDYPESTAGRRMQTEFVAVPPFWTIGQTIDYLREDADLPESFSQIFVIDPTFRLLASSISTASCARRAARRSKRSCARPTTRSPPTWTRKRPRSSSSSTTFSPLPSSTRTAASSVC